MSLNIVTRPLIATAAVLEPQGEVDMLTAPLLKEAILDQAENGVQFLIVNLRRVDYLDSTGLGVLIGGLRRMKEVGGTLKFCEPTPRISRFLEVTGVNTLIDLYSTEQDAVAATVD